VLPVAMIRPLALGTLMLLSAALPAGADEQRLGALAIRQVWARATPGPTAAVYAALVNTGTEPDRLMGADTPLAQRVELHEHVMSGAAMSMRHRADLRLEPGADLVLAPGGTHMMLFGLSRPLKPGDRFPLILEFERAGAVTVEVVVGAAGAMRAPE
jgi:periplasmic copper chaperone A